MPQHKGVDNKKIIDLNRNTIVVTDLNKAIDQADLFRGFKHEDKSFKNFDGQQNAYWDDIYYKLLTLKKEKDE